MTVAIAAHTHNTQHIVIVSDMRFSAEWISLESWQSKIRRIERPAHWLTTFSGDPDRWRCVMDRALPLLPKRPDNMRKIGQVLEEAYNEELRRKIDNGILKRWGMDLVSFRQRGPELGPERYAKIAEDIERVELGTSIILTGFDADGLPCIVSVTEPADELPLRISARWHKELGFEAIGQGSWLARSVLYVAYPDFVDVPQTVYRLCEAKFLSERAQGVGPGTVVMVLSKNGELRGIHPDRISEIRAACERNRPPIPPEALDVINTHLKPAREAFGQ